MDGHSGESRTIWTATSRPPTRPALGEHRRADICVIGAGITGLTTAYFLAQEGKAVIVVDDGPIGGGMTERTTAHLSNAIDGGYLEIERLHGEKGAQFAAESHTAAIDRIEAIATEEQIDCDFERLDGYLFSPPGVKAEVLQQELEAAHRAGLRQVQHVDVKRVAPFKAAGCLHFPRQAQFHPLKYLLGLAQAIEGRGGRIFTATHAKTIEGVETIRVTTDQGRIVSADAVVIATNTPITDLVTIHTKQAPYTTYVIAARIPTASAPKALYWDTLDPYHYVRLHSMPSTQGQPYDVLIVGGEDHKSGQADDAQQRYARLEAWAREQFPMIEDIEYRWSGQVMESMDGLAFIGPDPGSQRNVYIATGDSGMGLTHGTIAGILLTDLIMGRECSWASLYDPSRKTLRASGTYVKEQLNVAAQYTDWVTGGDVESEEAISRDSGAVLRRGLSKIAVYRDPDGGLHEYSAICPHLKCIVAWDPSEKTWNCPCHGSRFDKFGKVINGPANQDLEQIAHTASRHDT